MRPAYLHHPRAIRSNDRGLAFTLAETPPPEMFPDLDRIVDWMGVEASARWLPRDGKTFCNVYAHDVLHVLGGGHLYIPRTWWRDPESVTEDTEAVYRTTVRELSANGLFRWFGAHSEAFGWEELTESALKGALLDAEGSWMTCQETTLRVLALAVGVVVYNNRFGGSGHISVALPATERMGHGAVLRQTQAGAKNKAHFNDRWWRRMDPKDVRFYLNRVPVI